MREPGRGPTGFLADPVALQRLEGGVLFALSLVLFWKFAGPWLLYIVLILAPDLFMLGYLRGPRIGAAVYNFGHAGLLPGILVAVGVLSGARLAIAIALIWLGHIGVDRLLGYGLKLPTAFQDTHLGRIGRNR